MTSSLQHNSPTLGWVACGAKKRACRYGGDKHRTIEVSSNLEQHSSEIQKSASDGVIDAQETKDLSKSIADGILSPKAKEEVEEEPYVEKDFVPEPIPEDIKAVEAELYETKGWNSENGELYEARIKLNRVTEILNEATKENINYTNGLTRKKFELEEEAQNFTSKNFEIMYADGAEGAFGDDTRPKAVLKAKTLAHGRKLKKEISYIDYKLNKKDKFSVDTAKEQYLDKKKNYDALNTQAKKNDAKTVRLGTIDKDYFNTTLSVGPKLTVDSYNELIGELSTRSDMSEKEKIKNVKQLREELIVAAKGNYRADRPGSVVEKLENFFEKIKGNGYTPEQEEANFKKDTEAYNRRGLNLASFAKRLRESSWDSIIK